MCPHHLLSLLSCNFSFSFNNIVSLISTTHEGMDGKSSTGGLEPTVIANCKGNDTNTTQQLSIANRASLRGWVRRVSPLSVYWMIKKKNSVFTIQYYICAYNVIYVLCAGNSLWSQNRPLYSLEMKLYVFVNHYLDVANETLVLC